MLATTTVNQFMATRYATTIQATHNGPFHTKNGIISSTIQSKKGCWSNYGQTCLGVYGRKL